MHNKNELVKILSKDKNKNVNMINFVNTYPINCIKKVGESVLIRGKSDEYWVYISSSSNIELSKLVNELNDEDKYFAVIEDWMLPIVTQGKDLEWKLSCMKYIFPQNIQLPRNKSKIVELSIKDAEYIYDNYDYKKYTSKEYITERLQKDISLGIIEDDRLVGWIMIHDDGAIGMLNILPAYRKKGYGYELMTAMVKEVRQQGKIPFLHIEEDNIKSTSLALKVGFEKDRRVHWFKLR